MAKIKVLLADDHQIVRQGIKALLNAQADIEIIGEATDGHELMEMVERLCPDVVVTDIAMPVLNGIEAAGQIRRRFPSIEVIILSMHAASSYVVRSLRVGARGYILKSDDIQEVIEAIRAVSAGRRHISKQVSDDVLELLLSENSPELDLNKRLTDREREILQLIAEGNTNAQIAEKLVISSRTVETHRAKMMDKLGLSTQAEVIRFAIQNGFVSIDN